MVKRVCKICNSDFKVKSSHVKPGRALYCSKPCLYKSRRLGKTVNCHACETPVYKSQQALGRSKSDHFFCTETCQTIWRNKQYKEEKHFNWKGGGNSLTDASWNKAVLQKSVCSAISTILVSWRCTISTMTITTTILIICHGCVTIATS